MTRVLVVGGGIGGVSAAYAIKRRLDGSAEVTVASASPEFEFTPSNPWVALGWRDPRRIAFPIGPCLAARGIGFVPAAVRAFEPGRNRVTLEDGRALGYDFLVLATGPEGGFDEVPGLGPGARAFSVLRTAQAVAAREAYRDFVSSPGPVLVGAAPHAAILGPVYEMAFLIDADLRRRHIRRRVPITLVSPEPWPGHLGLGGEQDSRRLLEEALERSDIAFVGNSRTERAEPGRVELATDGKREEQRFAYAVYWPPFRGVRALRGSELAGERGFVQVDEALRSPRHPNVFALGACVAREQPAPTAIPIGAPESVYSIEEEAETLAGNVAAAMRGAPLASAAQRRAQWIADLGETGARFLSSPHVPLRDVNWLRQGTWVHAAKSEFEKYFVNKVRLGGGAQARELASLVSALQEGESGAAVPAARSVAVPVDGESARSLEAMAKTFGREPDDLAAALLRAALQDAEAYLDPERRKALARARREALLAQLPETDLRAHFHGGAP